MVTQRWSSLSKKRNTRMEGWKGGAGFCAHCCFASRRLALRRPEEEQSNWPDLRARQVTRGTCAYLAEEVKAELMAELRAGALGCRLVVSTQPFYQASLKPHRRGSRLAAGKADNQRHRAEAHDRREGRGVQGDLVAVGGGCGWERQTARVNANHKEVLRQPS